MKHVILYTSPRIWLAGLIFLLCACKKDRLPDYEGESSIYFYNPYYGYGLTYQYDVRDSASIYLGYNPADSLLKLPVKILGRIQNSDRPYVLVTDTDSSTAVAGRDYVLTTRQQIPANGYSDTIYLLFKNRQLLSSSLILILRLQANDHFALPLENARGGYENKYSWMPYRFKINIIYDAPKPYYWDANLDYLGAYSPEKLRLMISYFSLPLNTILNNGIVYNPHQIRSDAAAFKKYLQQEAAAGHIIREADGSPMQMGPKS
jgi:Domain of unknown function (DUF4843)